MSDAIHKVHPAASHHLPGFITAPGETDVLMAIMAVILLLAVLAFGLVFLRLHTLPERIAHKSKKLQFELVAVLGLIALFTHMHIFWVAGLLLALIELPDFGTPLGRIARSTEKIAGIKPEDDPGEIPLVPDQPGAHHVEHVDTKPSISEPRRDDRSPTPAKPELLSARSREIGHA